MALRLLCSGVRRRFARLLLRWLPGLALAAPAPAAAHLLNMTRVAVAFGAGPEIRVTADIDLSQALGGTDGYAALLAADPAAQERTTRELGQRLDGWIAVQADGQRLPLRFIRGRVPQVAPESAGDPGVAVMTTFELAAAWPAGAKVLALATTAQAPLEYPVALSCLAPAHQVAITRWIELPGTASREFTVPGAVLADLVPAAPAVVAAGVAPPVPAPVATADAAANISPTALRIAQHLETAGQYLWLGFLHILPRGADHILFVLGLFLLAPAWRPLLTQTTAFTVAHTTTLGLAAYGLVAVPSRIVEPLIALSIACVALENIFRPKLSSARLAVVFGFGLLHGLGFASSLAEVPLPRREFLTALLAFNFGVDFGQLTVIALAFGAVGWWRHRTWYRARIVIPACGLIAAVGLAWTGQRLFT